jgi:polysaccharide biosynthesis protein PslH
MRILQLIPKMPWPPKDGGAIAAWNLTTGLQHAGHKLTILAMNTNKHYVDPATLPAEVHQIAQWHTVPVSTRIRPLKALQNLMFGKLPYTLERFRSKAYEQNLRELLQKNEYDIVQCDGLAVALYIPAIRKYSSAKVVYRAHNIEWEIWERKASKEPDPFKKRYFLLISKRMQRFEKSLMNRYDLLIPITTRDNRILNKMGNTKPSCVIHSGVDPKQVNAGNIANSELSFAYIGALDWMPNQEGLGWFLDKVWAPFTRAHKDLRFYIAGRNAPPWLEKKIARFNGIVYEGEIDDARAFISAHPVFVAPLFSGSGMRVKIIEAMALGRIVLSTPLGAEGLPVKHEKDILLATRSIDFIETLDQMAWNLNRFVPIGENATHLILEKFDNFVLADHLASFYLKHLK